MDRLRELVLTRLNDLGVKGRPMSARQAALRSAGGVSYDTLYAIANGRHTGRLRDDTARGLADALDVPVERVYEAAGVPRPQTRWQPHERFDRLTIEQRKLLESMGAALLEAEQRGYERGRSGR